MKKIYIQTHNSLLLARNPWYLARMFKPVKAEEILKNSRIYLSKQIIILDIVVRKVAF